MGFDLNKCYSHPGKLLKALIPQHYNLTLFISS